MAAVGLHGAAAVRRRHGCAGGDARAQEASLCGAAFYRLLTESHADGSCPLQALRLRAAVPSEAVKMLKVRRRGARALLKKKV